LIKLAKIQKIDATKVILKLEQQSQCTDCKSRCSNGFLSFLFNQNDTSLLSVSLSKNQTQISHLDDDKHFFKKEHKIDDVIGLKFSQNQLFKMALILYGLPIVIVMSLLILGSSLFDLMGFNVDIGGVVGFFSGLFASRFLIQLNQQKIKPKVSFFK